jgi:phosphoribosylanthranilate isomerase
MNQLRVKICGLTRSDDAVLAAELGADALGFVFWRGSPRFVEPEAARAAHAAVGPLVARVGVFVNASPAEVREVVGRAELDVVQLHGDEPLEAYRGCGARLMKAAPLCSPADIERAAAWPADVMPLVDAIDPARRGGTGQVADWALAGMLAQRRSVMLAGGLHAGNVTEALQAVHPWGIDVSSGVEAAPGIKSPERLRALFAAVRAAVREVL